MKNIYIKNAPALLPDHIKDSLWLSVHDALKAIIAQDFDRFGDNILKYAPVDFLDDFAASFGLELYDLAWNDIYKRNAIIQLFEASKYGNSEKFLEAVADVVGARFVAVSSTNILDMSVYYPFINRVLSADDIQQIQSLPRNEYALVTDTFFNSEDFYKDNSGMISRMCRQLPAPGPSLFFFNKIGDSPLNIARPFVSGRVVDFGVQSMQIKSFNISVSATSNETLAQNIVSDVSNSIQTANGSWSEFYRNMSAMPGFYVIILQNAKGKKFAIYAKDYNYNGYDFNFGGLSAGRKSMIPIYDTRKRTILLSVGIYKDAAPAPPAGAWALQAKRIFLENTKMVSLYEYQENADTTIFPGVPRWSESSSGAALTPPAAPVSVFSCFKDIENAGASVHIQGAVSSDHFSLVVWIPSGSQVTTSTALLFVAGSIFGSFDSSGIFSGVSDAGVFLARIPPEEGPSFNLPAFYRYFGYRGITPPAANYVLPTDVFFAWQQSDSVYTVCADSSQEMPHLRPARLSFDASAVLYRQADSAALIKIEAKTNERFYEEKSIYINPEILLIHYDSAARRAPSETDEVFTTYRVENFSEQTTTPVPYAQIGDSLLVGYRVE